MPRHDRGSVEINVQVKRQWPPWPQLYRIAKEGVEPHELPEPDGEHSMSDPKTLQSFLKWVGERSAKDSQYCLVLWGHAFGLGFGRDHGNALTITELKQALEAFATQRGKPVELVGANACAMSYAEAARELKDGAKYLVASQIAVPFAGWPYADILKAIGPNLAPQALGETIARLYVNQHGGESAERVSMAVVDLGETLELERQLNELVAAIGGVLNTDITLRPELETHFRTAFLATTAGDVRPLLDLSDLCTELIELANDLFVPGVTDTPDRHLATPSTIKCKPRQAQEGGATAA